MALTEPGDATPDLPLGGPGTRDAIKAHLKITDDTDDAAIDLVTAAVNSVIRTGKAAEDAALPAAPTEEEPGEWPARISYGATLLGARWFRRKNSPAGVEAFGELGALYVMRNDPDIAQLLRLGAFAVPGVG
jgi:hypothetical protein